MKSIKVFFVFSYWDVTAIVVMLRELHEIHTHEFQFPIKATVKGAA